MGKRIMGTITREKLCDLIVKGKVSTGDEFHISAGLNPLSVTVEIIFKIVPNFLADTLLLNGETEKIVGEMRYMGGGKYWTRLGAHPRGSKDYHKLLDRVKD